MLKIIKWFLDNKAANWCYDLKQSLERSDTMLGRKIKTLEDCSPELTEAVKPEIERLKKLRGAINEIKANVQKKDFTDIFIR